MTKDELFIEIKKELSGYDFIMKHSLKEHAPIVLNDLLAWKWPFDELPLHLDYDEEDDIGVSRACYWIVKYRLEHGE
jgi:hypothetical protein